MVSVNIHTDNAYVRNGLEHFLFKYGIDAEVNKSEHPDITISYAEMKSAGGRVSIRILPCEISPDIKGYLEINRSRIPLFESPSKPDTGENNTVTAFFTENGKSRAAATSGSDELVLGFDIFGEIGYVLSGQLDSVFEKKTPESENIKKVPVVDILEDFLFRELSSLCDEKGVILEARPFWPDGKRFALCLTHDVDRVYKTYQYIPSILKSLVRGKPGDTVSQVKSFLLKHGSQNPYWCFDRITGIEKELGAVSTFYFLNEKGRLNPFSLKSWILYSGRYNLEKPEIADVISSLHKDGFEIGVHGSYGSYDNGNILAGEKSILEKVAGVKVSGIRQHYLNFDKEKTFGIQESLGFKYDTTIGFNPREGTGFRYGTSSPFHPFNRKTGERCSLLEIPLIIMDGALDMKTALSDCISLMETVSEYHGVLTVLWHQRMFNEREFPGMISLYKELIEAAGENAYISTAEGIYRWLTDSRWKSLYPDG